MGSPLQPPWIGKQVSLSRFVRIRLSDIPHVFVSTASPSVRVAKCDVTLTGGWSSSHTSRLFAHKCGWLRSSRRRRFCLDDVSVILARAHREYGLGRWQTTQKPRCHTTSRSSYDDNITVRMVRCSFGAETVIRLNKFTKAVDHGSTLCQQPPALRPMTLRHAGQTWTTSWKAAGQQNGMKQSGLWERGRRR